MGRGHLSALSRVCLRPLCGIFAAVLRPEEGTARRRLDDAVTPDSRHVSELLQAPPAQHRGRVPNGGAMTRRPLTQFTSRANVTATIHTITTRPPASFQPADRATVSRDGRFTAGPANSSAAAAPAGAPAVSKPSASGTSKTVGRAIGIAIKAV